MHAREMLDDIVIAGELRGVCSKLELWREAWESKGFCLSMSMRESMKCSQVCLVQR